jgi:hypothetical protein
MARAESPNITAAANRSSRHFSEEPHMFAFGIARDVMLLGSLDIFGAALDVS